MNIYVAEFIGTAILVLLGNGVVANVVLRGTKGADSGWIVITAGWGMGVFIAVWCVGQFSGAHINPAVSIGLASAGVFDWDLVPGYVAAQMIGAFVGTSLVLVVYRHHYAATDDGAAKLATFSTGPAIRSLPTNFITELVGTFLLVFAVLLFAGPSLGFDGATEVPALARSTTIGLGSLGALPVGLLVFAIGLSLGGTTGYAINPARDLGPRIAHAVLSVPGKGDSDWGYSMIPVFGPIMGGVAAAGVYHAVM
jgi:glycerol uptake facilitator protein